MSVSLGPALWQDGPTYNGESLRQLSVAAGWYTEGTADAMSVRSGVINNSVGSLQVTATSGMGLKVSAGFAVVASTASNIQAGYITGSMASVTLTVATASATNPRVDLVVIAVNENGDNTSTGYIDIIEGTAAASPVAPALPDNALALAAINVAANATSISSANISDRRAYTTAAGGVVPWPDMSQVVNGHPGLIAYDTANGRFFHNNSSGVNQFRVLPWAPVTSVRNATFGIATNTPTSWATATINCDGATDIKITVHWPGLIQNTTVGPRSVILPVYLDSTELDAVCVMTPSSGIAGIATNGGTSVYCTSSATGDTPSAGSHTISAKAYTAISAGGSGDGPAMYCTATRNAYLRVEPVIL